MHFESLKQVATSEGRNLVSFVHAMESMVFCKLVMANLKVWKLMMCP